MWNYGNVYCGAALSKNPDHGSYGGKARCGELPPPSRLGVLRRRLSPKQGERLVAYDAMETMDQSKRLRYEHLFLNPHYLVIG